MKSISELQDLLDKEDKKHSFSKVLAFEVMIGTFISIWSGVVDSEAEAFVLIALIGAAFGLDWGKTYVKSRNGGANGSAGQERTTVA